MAGDETLHRLARMRSDGLLSEEEYEVAKQRLLEQPSQQPPGPAHGHHRLGRALAVVAVLICLAVLGVLLCRNDDGHAAGPPPMHQPASATAPDTMARSIVATLIPAEGESSVTGPDLQDTAAVIRGRLDEMGVDAEVAVVSESVGVRIDAAHTDQLEVIRGVITRPARLQFRQVLEALPPAASSDAEVCRGRLAADPSAEVIACLRTYDAAGNDLPNEEWDRVRLGPVEVSGSELVDARAEIDPDSIGQVWYTALEFNGEGTRDFEEVTGRLACQQGVTRQLATVLDNVVEQASPIAQDIACGSGIPGGTAVIQATTETHARALAAMLTAGPLPVELTVATIE